MARKTKIVVISAEDRDQGKTFLITEMPPRKAEKWATRALNGIARAGANEVPDDFAAAGMMGLAALGIRAITTMDFADAEPLLDEMMECVAFVPDMTKTDQFTKLPFVLPLNDDHIEEVRTILMLRSEVIELHMGFSIAAYLSMLGETVRTAENTTPIPTSPPSSEPSLVAD